MTRSRTVSQLGITVVELLIAATIMILVLGMAGVFLAQQSQLQKTTQNRSELQDRVRVGMQLVAQDLALAGNSAVIAPDGSKLGITWPGCFDGAAGCVKVADSGSELGVRYLSSQFASGNECRDVSYRLSADGALERSDVACSATADFVGLVDNVVSFVVTVHCSNGADVTTFPSTSCPATTSYGRSATVELMARSRTAASGPSETGCPTDFVCYAMTQETLMPNMKDQ